MVDELIEARFRKGLVHVYCDVDDRRVAEYLRNSLTDLERFAETIAGHAW
jgi:uncharacterized protein YutE (UPF0331/DUF86 family)